VEGKGTDVTAPSGGGGGNGEVSPTTSTTPDLISLLRQNGAPQEEIQLTMRRRGTSHVWLLGMSSVSCIVV